MGTAPGDAHGGRRRPATPFDGGEHDAPCRSRGRWTRHSARDGRQLPPLDLSGKYPEAVPPSRRPPKATMPMAACLRKKPRSIKPRSGTDPAVQTELAFRSSSARSVSRARLSPIA